MNSGMKGRLQSGAVFGFLQTIMAAFAMLIPALYFSSLNITIVVYAVLLSIADVFSFLMKPFVGYLTDKYGERKFLLASSFMFVSSLFLIGQTSDLATITGLRIIGGVANALVFILIIIYGFRKIKEKPDKKIGWFNAIFNCGWIIGLLTPGFFMDKFGINSGFYLILMVGLIWLITIFRLIKKSEIKNIKIKPSFSFLKKIPLLLIYKTMDLAAFTTFVYFFTRFGLKNLGLSRSVVSIVVVVEVIAFAVSNYLIGRISNKSRRRYWIPVAVIFHFLGAMGMILGSNLAHYFLASAFIGIAGGFIDIWLFSHICETVKMTERGKFLGTFSWSYDLATIVGAQTPILFVLFKLNQFASLLVVPLVIGATYIISTLKMTRKVG
jgi:MFS family permease